MAQLPIIHYPDPRLRNKAVPVDNVDQSVTNLLNDMFETMYEAPGIGLAAPQVGVSKRIVVIDISEDKSDPLGLINPQIVEQDNVQELEEGCLSVPGIYEKVKRAKYIEMSYLNNQGVKCELQAEGLLAVCIQHEIDHLDGKLFVDYLSRLKKSRIKKKMEKMKRFAM